MGGDVDDGERSGGRRDTGDPELQCLPSPLTGDAVVTGTTTTGGPVVGRERLTGRCDVGQQVATGSFGSVEL